jgi:hypothetical protein
MNEIKQLIEFRTLPTGSAAYGLLVAKDNDRFCRYPVYFQLQEMIIAQGVPLEERGSLQWECLRFNLDGTTYDVFPVTDAELEDMRLITKTVAAACLLHPGAGYNKALRVALFEQMRATLKLWRQTS